LPNGGAGRYSPRIADARSRAEPPTDEALDARLRRRRRGGVRGAVTRAPSATYRYCLRHAGATPPRGGTAPGPVAQVIGGARRRYEGGRRVLDLALPRSRPSDGRPLARAPRSQLASARRTRRRRRRWTHPPTRLADAATIRSARRSTPGPAQLLIGADRRAAAGSGMRSAAHSRRLSLEQISGLTDAPSRLKSRLRYAYRRCARRWRTCNDGNDDRDPPGPTARTPQSRVRGGGLRRAAAVAARPTRSSPRAPAAAAGRRGLRRRAAQARPRSRWLQWQHAARRSVGGRARLRAVQLRPD